MIEKIIKAVKIKSEKLSSAISEDWTINLSDLIPILEKYLPDESCYEHIINVRELADSLTEEEFAKQTSHIKRSLVWKEVIEKGEVVEYLTNTYSDKYWEILDEFELKILTFEKIIANDRRKIKTIPNNRDNSIKNNRI